MIRRTVPVIIRISGETDCLKTAHGVAKQDFLKIGGYLPKSLETPLYRGLSQREVCAGYLPHTSLRQLMQLSAGGDCWWWPQTTRSGVGLPGLHHRWGIRGRSRGQSRDLALASIMDLSFTFAPWNLSRSKCEGSLMRTGNFLGCAP